MAMKKTEQPNFQVGGAYRAYTERHISIKERTGKLLCLLMLPALAYLILRSSTYLLLCLVGVLAVLGANRWEQNRLMAEYTALEQQRLGELEDRLTAMGLPAQRRCGFGYRRTEETFIPVFLVTNGTSLYLLENVFIKNCIYGVEGQMLYLFDLCAEALDRGFTLCDTSPMLWHTVEQNHQDLLRQEAMRLNDYLVIESFIYQAILGEMQNAKPKELLSTTLCLARMKKEQVYQTTLADGSTLLLPQRTALLLQGAEPQTRKAVIQ